MSIIEEIDGVVYFEKKPLMAGIGYILDDYTFSFEGEDYLLHELEDKLPEKYKKELGEEFLCLDKLEVNLPIGKYTYSLYEKYKNILKFEEFLKENYKYLSTKNIFKEEDAPLNSPYIAPPVQMRVLCTILIVDARTEKLNSLKSIEKIMKEIEKAKTAKRKKEVELSGCEDKSFVESKLSFYEKKLKKLYKEKEDKIMEQDVIFNEIEGFIEKNNLKEIYDILTMEP